MPNILKCLNCHQFDVEAYDEDDYYCARCKVALDNGLQELPDRTALAAKPKGKANDRDNDDDEEEQD